MKRKSTGSSSPDRRTRQGSPEEALWRTEEALRGLEFTPLRTRGQNFLVDPFVADAEAAMVDIGPDGSIVEIGGGLGELTRALLRRGFQNLTVIEIDNKLCAFLEANYASRVTVMKGDALHDPLPAADAYVGNLPFSSSTAILDRLLSLGMEHGVFLLQKEVSERLASPPGHRSYGPLTVLARLHGEFVTAATVPSTAFHPKPAVSGAISVFRRDPIQPAPLDLELLRRLLHSIFSRRRKKLSNSMAHAVGEYLEGPVDLDDLLRMAGFPLGWPDMRAEEITPEAYVSLSNDILSRLGYMPKGTGVRQGGR